MLRSFGFLRLERQTLEKELVKLLFHLFRIDIETLGQVLRFSRQRQEDLGVVLGGEHSEQFRHKLRARHHDLCR